MTEQPDNQNAVNNDAELGRALRNEVPPAGAGYWENIDARLVAAADEQPASGSGQVIRLDHSSDQSDTAAAVIRLTDMNPTTSPTPIRGLVLAVAAVAALIVGVVGFTALRDSAPSPVESADTVDEAPDINDADTDAADALDAPNEASEPGEPLADEAGEEPTLDDQSAVERRCFFEQYLPEDEPDPSVVWVIEVDGDAFRALLEFPIADGEISQTFDSGTFDENGFGQAGAGVVIRLSEAGASRSLDEIDPFTAAEVDCSSIVDVDERFARLAVGPPVIVPGSVDAPAESPADPTIQPPAAEDPVDDVPFEDSLIGLTENAAQTAVENADLIWRVVSRDGVDIAITKDYRENRINAVIRDGIVTETSIG